MAQAEKYKDLIERNILQYNKSLCADQKHLSLLPKEENGFELPSHVLNYLPLNINGNSNK